MTSTLLFCLSTFMSYVGSADSGMKGVLTYNDEKGVVTVRRFHIQEGFHRTLISEVIISSEAYRNEYPQHCYVALQEEIPSGMYIDIYQILAEKDQGTPQVLSKNYIDTEKPEYLSSSHIVHVYSKLYATDGNLGATLSIPVHLRYHRPSNIASYARVDLPTPIVLVRCKANIFHSWLGDPHTLPCDASNSSLCVWTQIAMKQDSLPLRFYVPVAKSDDSSIVMITTLLVTTAGVLFLFACFLMDSNPAYTLLYSESQDTSSGHSSSEHKPDKGKKVFSKPRTRNRRNLKPE